MSDRSLVGLPLHDRMLSFREQKGAEWPKRWIHDAKLLWLENQQLKEKLTVAEMERAVAERTA